MALRSPVSSYNSTVHYLFALQYRGMKFGLRNTRLLLKTLGNPHRAFLSIHVAGTNGKGSTSAFLASILQEAGYRTGLYTSPHLLRFTERVRINGVEIPSARLIAYVKKLRPVIEETGATFFEATTAIAFRYFADEQIDIAVIETGLGGRLDATNLVLPLASVITSIGLDHREILGTTVRQIAEEKGGIIKRGRPVVSRVENRAAEAVLRRIARQRSSPFWRAKECAPASGRREDEKMRIHFSGGLLAGQSVSIDLFGSHQVRNAQTAVATCSVLLDRGKLREVTPAHVAQGLARVRKNTGIRGRFEIIDRPGGRTIIDVAHNPEGIGALVRAVKAGGEHAAEIVFGVMADKEYRPMLRRLRAIGRHMVAVAPKGSRALGVEELAKEARKAGFTVSPAPSVARGVALARSRAGRKTVLVVGSHYLVAEALKGLS